jgi:2'-5' RNA ligase
MRIITVDDDREFYDKISQIPYLAVLISPPEQLQKSFEKIQRHLMSTDDRQIYHHSSYFHITVKGIGWLGEKFEEETLPRLKDEVEKVASSMGSFYLTLRGLNVWPTVIYADVQEGREQVRELHARMNRELGRYGVTPREYEGESMHPHLTVATFAVSDAQKLIEEVKRFEKADIGRMRVDRIRLIKTIPHKTSRESERQASFLEEIASFPLF